jgi:hypothetical protein
MVCEWFRHLRVLRILLVKFNHYLSLVVLHENSARSKPSKGGLLVSTNNRCLLPLDVCEVLWPRCPPCNHKRYNWSLTCEKRRGCLPLFKLVTDVNAHSHSICRAGGLSLVLTQNYAWTRVRLLSMLSDVLSIMHISIY